MCILGNWVWANAYSRRQRRSLFWRMRSALKRAIKNGGKHQLKFQYDPWSYALNFDDGCCSLEQGTFALRNEAPQCYSDIKITMWVYVLWVKSECDLSKIETKGM